MPRTVNEALLQGKRNRNNKVREFFRKLTSENKSVEYTLGECVKEFGMSESTILKIIKRHGCYQD